MKKTFILLLTTTFAACSNKDTVYDATGTFEAVETIVSAEAAGVIKRFDLEEGQVIYPGQQLGYIDSTQLYLKNIQLKAQVAAVLSKRPDIATQTAALKEQLKQAEHEQQRVANMLRVDAATPKQMDDANTQVAFLKKQLVAQQSSLEITDGSMQQESIPLEAQIRQIEDQLLKTRIINTTAGTVITKYAEVNELTSAGKPLYKVAALNTILLRAYITADQLIRIKLGQKVTVLADSSDGTYKSYPGTVEWISNKAEFTPKTIQTKDERANLVYAIKIKVNNDGFLKIGMYADVKF